MGLSKIYHFCIFAYYCSSYHYYCLNTYPKALRASFRPEGQRYGGDTKYLTMWCLFFQIFYFFFCCLTDVVQMFSGDSKKSSTVKYFVAIRDWFLCSVAFPIGLMVVLMFWSIWSVDRQLVFPKELDEFFPMWLNHVLHTNPLPILLLDMWLVRHQHPSRQLGLLGLFSVAAAYMTWILWLGFVMDIWVYPILKVLDGTHFALFIAVTAMVPIPVYFLGEWCISAIHGPSWKTEGKLEKKA